MNLNEELVLAFLEEDNVQRAFFRVMPQLTSSGDIREEAKNTWLDNGALRVVPDRNEQHTFKDRMRSLGSWCVIDLTIFPAEASKIRTNKNYRPERGESNQYIIYSDAVKAVPSRVFYEVFDAAPSCFAEAAQMAITPSFFLREKDVFYGPVSRDNPQEPQPAPEMEATLYEFDSPDGKLHTVLCVAAENLLRDAPALPQRPAEAAQALAAAPVQPQAPSAAPETAEALPIGKPLHILDERLSFEETVQELNKPLNEDSNLLRQRSAIPAQPGRPAAGRSAGTPLYQTPFSTSSPQPRDRLAEVVSGQSRAARSEPYAEPLPSGARLKPVFNPIEHACDTFKKAWETMHSRPQLVNCVMSLDGMKALLERRQQIATNSATALQAALQQHLSDLEAERLNILVHLDQAKSDMDAYRQKAIAEASALERKEQESLAEKTAELRKTVDELRQEITVLGNQRSAMERELTELAERAVPMEAARVLREHKLAAFGTEQMLRPVPGAPATVDELLARIEEACGACRISYMRNAGITFLALIAVCDRMTLVTEEPGPLVTLIQNLVDALGWSDSVALEEEASQQIIAQQAGADSTPSLVISLTDRISPIPNACRVMIARNADSVIGSLPYSVNRWPVCQFDKFDFIPRVQTECQPLSLKALRELKPVISPEEIDRVLKDIYILIPQLSGKAREQMNRFIGICATLMEGSIADALDWAIRLWLLPAFAGQKELCEALKPLLYEYPVTLKALG